MSPVKGNGPCFWRGVLLLSLSVAIGCVGSDPISPNRQPNILVLSFCSLRTDHLSAYGYEKATTPNLLEFSKKAFVFRNGISGLSWVNALTFVEELPTAFFASHGYVLPGTYSRFIRIPQQKGLELDTKPGMEYLRQLLLTPQLRPFFLEVHLKYQHFPYLDSVNHRSETGTFLSEKSRALLQKYLSAPERFPDKLPLLTVLLRDKDLILRHPLIRRWMANHPRGFNPDEPFGIVNNGELLERWKKSDGYADDLELLKEAYDSKLRNFDTDLREILNLYGDRELSENTIVIVVGDHGEAFMDHGYLIHGETVNDEVLRFPLMVRFPRSKLKGPHFLDHQFFQGSFTGLIRGLVDGSLREPDFGEIADRLRAEDSAIVSRNCRGNLRSVRFENRWKLILDINTREKKLFDLAQDPGETRDVYSGHPEVVGKLEELLMRGFGRSENDWDRSCTNYGVE